MSLKEANQRGRMTCCGGLLATNPKPHKDKCGSKVKLKTKRPHGLDPAVTVRLCNDTLSDRRRVRRANLLAA
jgi:hypothetical protein